MSSAIRIGNAPCSWGVVKDAEGQESIGWRQVLDEIAAAGYAGTELGDWGFMPDDPGLLRAELGARDLAMIGAFTPVVLSDPSMHARGVETALRTARLLAAVAAGREPFVVLADSPGPARHRVARAGRIRPEDGLTGEGWEALAAGAERIAQAVRDETGLRTAFHHHCATFVETAGETARLLEMTDPELVGLCFDSGHFMYAGDDPLEALRRFRARVWLVHFKDCHAPTTERARREAWDYVTAVRRGVFCGLGEGAVDHAAIYGELARTGYKGWIVVENEQPPGRVPPLVSAQKDRAYLAGLGL